MNNQVNYIVYGILNLEVFSAVFALLSKIPGDIVAEEKGGIGNNVAVNGSKGPFSEKAARGKMVYQSKCAACHHLFKEAPGTSLYNAITSDRWADRNQLVAWIRNPADFMKDDKYTQNLKLKFGSTMPAFPGITYEVVDELVEYIKSSAPAYY